MSVDGRYVFDFVAVLRGFSTRVNHWLRADMSVHVPTTCGCWEISKTARAHTRRQCRQRLCANGCNWKPKQLLLIECFSTTNASNFRRPNNRFSSRTLACRCCLLFLVENMYYVGRRPSTWFFL